MPPSLMERFQPYNVSRESLERLERYVAALTTWQKRINLIGPSTVENIWERHILDAVQILPLLPRGAQILADLGSGAGIPGLVLAVAGGQNVHLYESNGKKCAFLREAARVTGAAAKVHNLRIETIGRDSPTPDVQVVLARAFAPLTELLDYAAPFLNQGAIGLFHKGQDVGIELTEATKYWKLQYEIHQSHSDSRGVILKVLEAVRV